MSGPGVDTWHVPPRCQGQMVERAYGVGDGREWLRVTDRSDGSVEYFVALDLEGDDDDTWEPWNAPPVRAWVPWDGAE